MSESILIPNADRPFLYTSGYGGGWASNIEIRSVARLMLFDAQIIDAINNGVNLDDEAAAVDRANSDRLFGDEFNAFIAPDLDGPLCDLYRRCCAAAAAEDRLGEMYFPAWSARELSVGTVPAGHLVQIEDEYDGREGYHFISLNDVF